MTIVDVVQLSKSFATASVLNSVSFSLQQGEFVGLIGPNGAGKTTILKCLTGQLLVPERRVFVCGHDLALDALSAKRCFGYALDPAMLPAQLTGAQFIELIAAGRHITPQAAEIHPLIEMLSMEGKIGDYIGTYSQGMRQKLSIICALMGNPPLLVLDESLNGLDPLSSYHLKEYLNEVTEKGSASVLLSTHLIASVEKYCTKVILLHEGTVRRIWSRDQLVAEMERTNKDLEQIFVDIMARD